MNDPMPSEFASHLREMSRHRRLIAAIAIGVAVVALVVGMARPATYEAEAIVRVSLAESTGDDGAITDFHAGSLAALANADRVVVSAARLSGDDRTPSKVRESLSAELGESRGFVVLTATAPTPEGAARLANALARSLAADARRDPSARSVGMGVSLVEAARPADAVPSVTTGRAVGGAVALGLVAAIVVAEGLVALRLLRGRLSPVDPASDLARLLGAPTLDLRGVAGNAAEFSFYQEHLRARPLITVIHLGDEPSSDVAVRLARVADEAHRRVLLVDADVGQPIVRDVVGHEVSPAAVDVAAGDATIGAAVVPVGDDTRTLLLPVGALPPGTPAGRRRLDGVRQLLADTSADQVIVSASRRSSIDELLRVAHAFPHAVVLSVDADCGIARIRAMLELLRPVEVTVVAGVVR